MNDFSVFGSIYDHCLNNLDLILQRCKETNLILNWQKCYFMICEGIVLNHKISLKDIEVDKVKVKVIEKMPPPIIVKGIRKFFGHAGFYQWFIKDCFKIAKPLCDLLTKDVLFHFNDECLFAFNRLKKKLVSTPIIASLDWSLHFKLMCDSSDFTVGAVLGQKHDKRFHVIYYASKILMRLISIMRQRKMSCLHWINLDLT